MDEQNLDKGDESKNRTLIIVAIVGAVSAIITALITGWFSLRAVQEGFEATMTSTITIQETLPTIALLPEETLSGTKPPTKVPPTVSPTPDPILFRDDFDLPTLTDGWFWMRENVLLWSLSEQPGSLKIVAGNSYMLLEGGNSPLLLRNTLASDLDLRTQLLFSPTQNFQGAGLIIYQEDDYYIALVHAYCDNPDSCVGDGVYLDDDQRQIAGDFFQHYAGGLPSDQQIFLRLVREGDTYTGYWSLDGEEWIFVAETNSTITPLGVGLVASNSNTGAAPIPAYYDFFEIRTLSP